MKRVREIDPQKYRDRDLIRFRRITPAEYDALLASQGGGCAICGVLKFSRNRTRMAVDHDHSSGAIRGVLCNGCNTGIGLLGDDPRRLDLAAAYLRRHRAPSSGAGESHVA